MQSAPLRCGRKPQDNAVKNAGSHGFRPRSVPAEALLRQLSADELRHHLQSVERVTEVALSRPSYTELVREAGVEIRSIFTADRVAILLLDEGGEALHDATGDSPAPVSLEGSPLGVVLAQPGPVAVEELSLYDPSSAAGPAILAPLRAAGDPLGLLLIGSVAGRTFTDPELYLAEILASRLAVAIWHARIETRANEQARERQAAEVALAESEGRYRLLAETAADAIVTIDPESVIVSANPAAADAFGYEVQELIGKSFTEFIPERFRQPHLEGMRRYLATGERRLPWRGLELPGLRRDGAEVLFEVSFGEREVDGVHYFTGTMRDVTERKRTERILAAQFATTRAVAGTGSVEAAVPAILEGIGESLAWEAGVFWRWEDDAGLLRAVHIWISPTVSADEFVRATVDLTFQPGVGLPGRVWKEQKPSWIPDLVSDSNFPRSVAAAGVGFRTGFAFPVCVGDDCLGVVEFYTSQKQPLDERLLNSMEALGADIGQYIRRSEAEKRLEEQENLQRFFGEVSAALAASVLDFDATVRRLVRLAVPGLADACAVDLHVEELGEDRLEVASAEREREPELRRFIQLLHDAASRGSTRIFDADEPKLLQGPGAFEPYGEDVVGAAAAAGVVGMLAVPLQARGHALGTVLLVSASAGRDFNPKDLVSAAEFAHRAALALDNARLYRQSQQANRAKADFLATVSHELRTPLNAVIGYSDLLKMGMTGGDPAKSAEYADRIGVSARHLSQLIEEVLAFSRIESGRETVSAGPVDLEALLGEVEVIAGPLAAEKGLRLEIRPPTQAVEMHSDARKFRQILLNVIGNAIKFTEEGEVAVAVQQLEDQVEIAIRDTGIGIEEDKIEQIFEPFWQVEQGTTRQAGGTGLGLTVTKRYVELLGGRITVDSRLGKGTTVRITLPVRYDAERIRGLPGPVGVQEPHRAAPASSRYLEEAS